MATGKEIADMLHELVDRDMAFMHICGTHEAAIARSGLAASCPTGSDRDGARVPGLHHPAGRDRCSA